MTDLSVVIVSYNVRAFLEQCLVSVERASKGLNVEVWVVDNKSVDGSVDMVKRRFPWVKLIANEDNVGFSVANNQAIRKSSGKHVLLLNPDTVVREDTFAKGLEHMDAHPKVGGMGVPMYDGTGKYLPESKRGLPTPWVAFCRMAGLHHFAPTSEKFNAYYAGHLGEHDTGPVDILAGAYMWMRKEALDEVGLLDEQFFMYGEDIDLSWRLVLGGWENHYCANTSIIHYKGESTKKGSLNYVMVFYNAMLLFAAKHYEGRQARAFSWMIRVAIYGRAALAVVRRMLSRWGDLIRVAGVTLVLFGAWLWALDALGQRQFNWSEVLWQGGLLWALQTAALTLFGGHAEAKPVAFSFPSVVGMGGRVFADRHRVQPLARGVEVQPLWCLGACVPSGRHPRRGGPPALETCWQSQDDSPRLGGVPRFARGGGPAPQNRGCPTEATSARPVGPGHPGPRRHASVHPSHTLGGDCARLVRRPANPQRAGGGLQRP